jgi:general secretion pathway protein D
VIALLYHSLLSLTLAFSPDIYAPIQPAPTLLAQEEPPPSPPPDKTIRQLMKTPNGSTGIPGRSTLRPLQKPTALDLQTRPFVDSTAVKPGSLPPSVQISTNPASPPPDSRSSATSGSTATSNPPSINPSPSGASPANPSSPIKEKDKSKDKKCKALPPYVKVRMYFNEAEVMEIVQWISELTCKNFIISDAIRGGKITILSNTEVTAEEAYRAFLSALNVNNMTIVESGKFYKLQMKRDATKDTIPTYIGDEKELPHSEQMVTRLLQLHFADVSTVNGTISQLVTKDGSCFPYAPTNSMIISDIASNMYRLDQILKQLDTPLGQEEIRIVQVNFAAAVELAKTIEEIFSDKARSGASAQGAGGSQHRIPPIRPGSPDKSTTTGQPQPESTGGEGEESITLSKVIADERTNKLILVATSRSFVRIQELIEKLDVPIAGEGQIQVVPLENANAEELAATLTALAQGTANRPKSAGASASRPAPGTTAQKTAAELFQGEVKVTADKATNSLVIVANQGDFRNLLKVIKKLDISRRQVFVEAVIMEVNLDNTQDTGLALHGGAAADIGGEKVPLLFGTQFKMNGQNFNSLMPNLSALGFLSGIRGPNLSSTDSYLGSITIPKFGVMLQALQTDSNVNVLSTPHIITSDNEDAEIKVGEQIPVPAGYGGGMSGLGSLSGLASMASQYTGTTGTTAGYNNSYGSMGGLSSLLGLGMGAINRQEVGLTLKVKPQINEGNVVRMELEVELSEVKDTSNPLGPTTTKRSAKTVVLPRDQETVVVGGLIREKLDIGESKVPILGDIPVLGWLFRTKHEQRTKTNLLLFLTPYVIEGPEDFRAIFERKMRERKEFLDQSYIAGPDYKTFIDFRKKHGPLADIHLTFLHEMTKLENGGTGTGAEVVITPQGKTDPEKPEKDTSASQPAPLPQDSNPVPVVEPDQQAPAPAATEESKENRLEVE